MELGRGARLQLLLESGPDKLSLGKAVSRNSRTWDKNVFLSLSSPPPRGLCLVLVFGRGLLDE